MKDCLELEELLKKIIGDDVVGFFERRMSTTVQEVRVFTPVYAHRSKSEDFVN